MLITVIPIAMCVTYVVLLALFPRFFAQETAPRRKWFLLTFAYIIAFSALIYTIVFFTPDLALGNRILHAFGGGFLAFSVCFFAARNSGVRIDRFQFFVFSALIVLALGIGNELFELVLQEYSAFTFAYTVTDTWLDLASNVVGVIIAGACFVPFYTTRATERT